ncbi:hypothetical protein V6R21_25855 [Limibacter armeniacum]|uniref:hypothetical protein n=1 Tax=Limibacter armeniacum TaxID=466084 RepID=UPI002FE63859
MRTVTNFKTFCLIAGAFLSSHLLQAQSQPTGYYLDALRYSRTSITGSARMQSMGGVGVALGGDISNAFTNPAGLGFNRKSEYHFAPSLYFANTDASGNGVSGSESQTKFNFPLLGVIFSKAKGGPQTWKGGSFAIAYTRLNDFNGKTFYEGDGTNQTSMVDYFNETAQGLPLGFLEDEKQFSSTIIGSLGYSAEFLRVTKPNASEDTPQSLYTLIFSSPDSRDGQVSTSGAQQEFSFAYGANFGDRVYVGAKLGIQTFRYDKDQYNFEGRNGSGDLQQLNFSERFRTDGTGFNGSIGAIFRAHDYLRVGLVYTLPTYYNVTDIYSASLSADYNNLNFDEQAYFQFIVDSGVSDPPNPADGDPNVSINGERTAFHEAIETQFNMRTPYKLAAGLTGFLGKRGLLSADFEYVAYNTAKLKKAEEYVSSFDQVFPLDVTGDNEILSNEYRGVVNINIGTELRFGQWYARGGYALKPDPRKKDLQTIKEFNFEWDQIENPDVPMVIERSTKSNAQFITFGGGFRNQRFFADLAIVVQSQPTYLVPYQLDVRFPNNFLDPNLDNYQQQLDRVGEDTEIVIHPTIKVDESNIRAMLSIGTYF